MKSVFKVDGVEYPNIRVLSLKQSFEILDGENAGRVLTGEMKRDIIGTYFNYTLKIKPEYSVIGMTQYNGLMDVLSNPVDSHLIEMPYDIGRETNSKISVNAYITSGEREMLKYDINNVDYWKPVTLKFIAISPKKRA